ncbi:MAG: lysine--tRNA ligase [Parcubacteria group bacterium CG10_big_fil_rev_8_21_14_0_10_38_31]|nr:MAG: lysine--tRNA ligase [Parcubacteria group bacterium CG10_big_fil_rev_8_21_14_0_10_38_31]
MSSFEEIRNERIKKLNLLKGSDINPYPIDAKKDYSTEEAIDNFVKLSKRKKPFFMAGRVMTVRGHGGSTFIDFLDDGVRMQAYLKKDEVGEGSYRLFIDTVDMGDFVELGGTLFKTKKNEKTLKVSGWKMLSKSIRPLPDKWHGLSDIDERFRKRYLDLLMSVDVRNRFIIRSKIISEIRSFLNKESYLEVETPLLQPLAGGATAEPFITHHNTLDIDLYLRIAPELYLKQLLVGGFSKVYEIGRNFRNEGISPTHNPEFTMLEFYEAYSNAENQRAFIEKMFKLIVKNIFKKSSIEYNGNTIDFSKKFSVISYFDLLKKYTLMVNPFSLTRDDIALKAKQFGIKVEDHEAKEKIIDNIYKKICRPKLIQPTFIIDYPAEFSPFAKKKENNPLFIDRFQLIIGGIEIVNAFSELNDPLDQKERFLEQDRKRKEGEAEVSPSDEGYLEAMEYGMPPAGGVGVGVDRLVMLLSNTQNIKEVIFFPTMKPKAIEYSNDQEENL